MAPFLMNLTILWGLGLDSGTGSVAHKRLISVCEGEIEAGIAKVGVIKVVEVVEERAVTEAVHLTISRSAGIVEDCRRGSGRIVDSIGLLVGVEGSKEETLLLRGEEEVGWQRAAGTSGSHHE